MYKLEIHIQTHDELLEVAGKLAGIEGVEVTGGDTAVGTAPKGTRAKAGAKKAEGVAATAASFTAPATPAPVAAGASVDDCKNAIKAVLKGESDQLKCIAFSRGIVSKHAGGTEGATLSSLTDGQRAALLADLKTNGVAALGAPAEAEFDPLA